MDLVKDGQQCLLFRHLLSKKEHNEREAGRSYKGEDAAATEPAHLMSSSRLAMGEITAPFSSSTGINCLQLLSILCILGFSFALAVPSAPHCHGSPTSPHKQHPHGTHHQEARGRPKQAPHEPPCGSTPTEAKAGNFIFEQHLGAWVHPTCAWQEIVDGFRKMNSDLKREVAATDVPKLQNGNSSVIYRTYPQAYNIHYLYCQQKFWRINDCVTLIAETLTDQGKQHQALTYLLLYHDCVPLTLTIVS
ncbi:hypothetical protein LX32DRAFT_661193 [Colletotrichum zoysiae]|uniref:Uncharacterized protein n=1 Tax=Colletotrichum zoysiae TaxID=1216348 RepID=A0AAD9M467_9PEZI|nr:hypothetical protein LX32DRAFT_661193 [Colletotrichum zoysiae]